MFFSRTAMSIGLKLMYSKRRWRGRARSIPSCRNFRNESTMSTTLSRRQAIKVVAGATMAAAVVSSTRTFAQEKPMAPDKRIRLGVIGVGARGSGLLDLILRQDPAVEIPALCD